MFCWWLFIFLLSEQKKNETKRKLAGSRYRAKKWRFFLNEKNSLMLRQLFVLHGKISIFLHALSTKCRSLFRLVGINFALLVFGLICFCLCVRKREKNLPQRAKRCCEECPASLFEREMEGVVWSVKKEKLFERSEFFSFSGMPDRSSSKVQTAVFLFCYLFLSAGRKKK